MNRLARAMSLRGAEMTSGPQFTNSLLRRACPPVRGTFHFENLVMPPLTKTCSKMVLSHKGGSLCVKNVFAKKFFRAGRDSTDGAHLATGISVPPRRRSPARRSQSPDQSASALGLARTWAPSDLARRATQRRLHPPEWQQSQREEGRSKSARPSNLTVAARKGKVE